MAAEGPGSLKIHCAPCSAVQHLHISKMFTHLAEDVRHLHRATGSARCALLSSRSAQNPLRGRRVTRADRGWTLHSRTSMAAMPRERSLSRGGRQMAASGNGAPQALTFTRSAADSRCSGGATEQRDRRGSLLSATPAARAATCRQPPTAHDLIRERRRLSTFLAVDARDKLHRSKASLEGFHDVSTASRRQNAAQRADVHGVPSMAATAQRPRRCGSSRRRCSHISKMLTHLGRQSGCVSPRARRRSAALARPTPTYP